MADFVAVLRKTIDGLGETTPEVRRKVYDKARATIASKLAQITPPPSPAAAEKQKKALEDAIILIESQYVPKQAEPEPADELDEFFASLAEAPAKPNGKAPTPSALTAKKVTPPTDEVLPSSLAVPVVRETEKHVPRDIEKHDEDAFDFHQPEMMTMAEPEIYSGPRRRSRWLGWVSALVILLIIVGGAYAGWMKREELASKLGVDLPRIAKASPEVTNPASAPAKVATQTPPPAAEPKVASEPPANKPATPAPAAPAPQTPSEPAVQKFTERLMPNGSETNPGPGGGAAKIGEGTSVAAATTAPAPAPAKQQGTPPAQTAQTTPAKPEATGETQLPVGQHAIFYEERTDSAQGSAQNGSVVWSVVKESPGGDAPPEPAIRAEATIPGKDVQLRMTIRRNTDQTLPASHIIELIFLTPDHFEGGGIDSVLRVAMKDSEQSPGSPLLGIPAKISDGFFLFALNNDKASEETNLNLLKQQSWIDIPIVYKSGRRALITLEKGIPGNKAFDEAMKAWAQAPSSSG